MLLFCVWEIWNQSTVKIQCEVFSELETLFHKPFSNFVQSCHLPLFLLPCSSVCRHATSNMSFWPKLVEPWCLSISSALLYVLCNKTSNVLKVWHRWHGFLLVLWFDITPRKTHTGHTRTIRHKYRCIFTLLAMYTQQLPVLCWMIYLLIQKFNLKRSAMSLLFKNYLLVEVKFAD